MFAYNKPDTTKKVLKAIASVKPKNFYIILDGPKSIKENRYCNQTKKILENINWDCNVERVYSEKNLGLKKRFKSGLDYVFNFESSAIILEDDTLPSKTFFQYCDDLLELHSENKEIAQINGFNYLSKVDTKDSYYFSIYPEIWGWATWRDRWFEFYNDDLNNWEKVKNTQEFRNLFYSDEEYKYYFQMYENAYKDIVDSWDFKWTYSLRMNKKISVSPSVNLIKNLGFGHKGATHTLQRHKYLSVTRNKKFNMKFPIKHPVNIVRNGKFINMEFNKKQLKNSKISKLIYFFKKITNFLTTLK